MRKKPIIGISGSQIPEQGVFAGTAHAGINDAYVAAVMLAGGVPLILPCVGQMFQQDLLPRMIGSIDGLILSGGHDLTPSLCGQEALPKLGETWLARDAFDLHLFEQAMQKHKPVFGICRGFQLINVALGGELLKDAAYSGKQLLDHVQTEAPAQGSHRIDTVPGTVSAKILSEQPLVNSFHHQIVSRAGTTLTVAAYAADVVIEAVEHSKLEILGTQWHPELMVPASDAMQRLFGWFIRMAV